MKTISDKFQGKLDAARQELLNEIKVSQKTLELAQDSNPLQVKRTLNSLQALEQVIIDLENKNAQEKANRENTENAKNRIDALNLTIRNLDEIKNQLNDLFQYFISKGYADLNVEEVNALLNYITDGNNEDSEQNSRLILDFILSLIGSRITNLVEIMARHQTIIEEYAEQGNVAKLKEQHSLILSENEDELSKFNELRLLIEELYTKYGIVLPFTLGDLVVNGIIPTISETSQNQGNLPNNSLTIDNELDNRILQDEQGIVQDKEGQISLKNEMPKKIDNSFYIALLQYITLSSDNFHFENNDIDDVIMTIINPAYRDSEEFRNNSSKVIEVLKKGFTTDKYNLIVALRNTESEILQEKQDNTPVSLEDVVDVYISQRQLSQSRNRKVNFSEKEKETLEYIKQMFGYMSFNEFKATVLNRADTRGVEGKSGYGYTELSELKNNRIYFSYFKYTNEIRIKEFLEVIDELLRDRIKTLLINNIIRLGSDVRIIMRDNEEIITFSQDFFKKINQVIVEVVIRIRSTDENEISEILDERINELIINVKKKV